MKSNVVHSGYYRGAGTDKSGLLYVHDQRQILHKSSKLKHRFSPTAWLRFFCPMQGLLVPFPTHFPNTIIFWKNKVFSHWSGLCIAAQAHLKCFWECPWRWAYCTRVTFFTKVCFMASVCRIYHMYACEPFVLIPETYPGYYTLFI